MRPSDRLAPIARRAIVGVAVAVLAAPVLAPPPNPRPSVVPPVSIYALSAGAAESGVPIDHGVLTVEAAPAGTCTTTSAFRRVRSTDQLWHCYDHDSDGTATWNQLRAVAAKPKASFTGSCSTGAVGQAQEDGARYCCHSGVWVRCDIEVCSPDPPTSAASDYWACVSAARSALYVSDGDGTAIAISSVNLDGLKTVDIDRDGTLELYVDKDGAIDEGRSSDGSTLTFDTGGDAIEFCGLGYGAACLNLYSIPYSMTLSVRDPYGGAIFNLGSPANRFQNIYAKIIDIQGMYNAQGLVGKWLALYDPNDATPYKLFLASSILEGDQPTAQTDAYIYAPIVKTGAPVTNYLIPGVLPFYDLKAVHWWDDCADAAGSKMAAPDSGTLSVTGAAGGVCRLALNTTAGTDNNVGAIYGSDMTVDPFTLDKVYRITASVRLTNYPANQRIGVGAISFAADGDYLSKTDGVFAWCAPYDDVDNDGTVGDLDADGSCGESGEDIDDCRWYLVGYNGCTDNASGKIGALGSCKELTKTTVSCVATNVWTGFQFAVGANWTCVVNSSAGVRVSNGAITTGVHGIGVWVDQVGTTTQNVEVEHLGVVWERQ